MRAHVIVPSRAGGLPAVAAAGGPHARADRRVFFYGHGWRETPVHARGGIDPGSRMAGPAVVRDEWSTVVVYPGQALRCDGAGLLWIEAA